MITENVLKLNEQLIIPENQRIYCDCCNTNLADLFREKFVFCTECYGYERVKKEIRKGKQAN